MSYSDEAQKSGAQPFNWIELHLERCNLRWGTTNANGTCPAAFAAGQVTDKCYNSWATCDAPDSFSPETVAFKFCEPVENMPLDQGFIPFLQPADEGGIRVSPGETDPGNSLGKRIQVTFKLMDAPHDDVGVDHYVADRKDGSANIDGNAFDPLDRGTFWPRHRRRWPHYLGRKAVWYEGWLPQEPTKLDQTITTAEDLTTNNNDGTLTNGPTWVSDGPNENIRGALEFDGVDDKVVVGDVAELNFGTGDFTLEAWIKTTDTVGGNSIFHKGLTINQDVPGYEFATNSSGFLIGAVGDGTNMVRPTGTTAINDGLWHHVQLVREGTTIKVRLDGADEASDSDASLGSTDNTDDFQFGSRVQNFYDGMTTDARSWNVARTLTQTADNMNTRLNGDETGLVGYWRLNDGFVRNALDVSNFKQREYIIESLKGPGSDSEVTVVVKDPIKKADRERAQCPFPTDGELDSAIAEGASPSTIDVLISDQTAYDLKAGETEDYVCIGDEVWTYTGTTNITGGVQLTGVTRSAPSPYTTEAQDHDAGDQVQRCRLLSGRPIDVFQELLEDYAGLPSAYVPFSEWETEHTTWLAGLEIERLIVEPEGVNDLIDEIIPQSMTWGLWWKETEQTIGYRAIRPADIDESVATLTDDDHLVADSIDIVDEPDRLVNQVRILYGQRDPTENKDELGNYRSGLLESDLDSKSDREVGEVREKIIYARWHPASNDAEVSRISRRLLASRVRNLQRIEFEVAKKDDLKTAEFCDLNTIYLRDELGAPRDVRVQILRVSNAGDTNQYTAREDFFLGNYGRLAPAALDGLEWADATEEQRAKYFFLADANGEMSDGSDGYRLL